MKTILALLMFCTLGMAEVSITGLPSQAGAVVGATDVFPVVDVPNNVTVKVLVSDLFSVPSLANQLTLFAPKASPSFTGTIGTPLTISSALVTDSGGNLAASGTSATELGYVTGVTSAIQSQLNGKISSLNPVFTGTVTLPTGAGFVRSSSGGVVSASALSGSDLPLPGASSLGGVFSLAVVSHNFLTGISSIDGSVSQAQPAFTDISGSVAAAQLPNPGASSLGGVQSKASVSHNFLTQISTSGVVSAAQPAFSDISGSVGAAQLPLPAIASLGGVYSQAVVSHNWINGILAADGSVSIAQPAFTDISGSVAASQLPNPSVSTLGGVQSKASVSHNFLTQIGTDGSVSQAQPAFTDISGSVAASQLPNPGVSSLGGVQSKASVSHNFLTQISTSGVVSQAQPAFSDISGSVGAAQLPLPAIASLGGVFSLAVISHNFLTGISSIDGSVSQAQPAFTDISGSVAAAQLPNPGASSLGGVQSKASVSHNFLTQISTSGVVSAAQPAFSDISGTVASSQLPFPGGAALGGVLAKSAISHFFLNQVNSVDGAVSSAQPDFTDLTGNATVPQGGTGQTSLTAYAVLAGGTTSTGAVQHVSGLGSSGQILTSNGAGALPTWQSGGTGVSTVGAFSGSSQTDGANITGATITFGPADASNPGMVSTGTQTLAGAKTFSTSVTTPSSILSGSGGNVTMQASSSPTTSYSVLWPAAQGAASTYLRNDGSGNLSWSASSSVFTAPTVQSFTSTGTITGYQFTVTSANATVGATYTNNGHTFTILSTISGATSLFTSGASAPTGSGTLTKSGGSGDSTITFSANQALATYTTPGSALYIKVTAVGGGGGGGASGNVGGTCTGGGATGGTTFFGAALISATGGGGGGCGGSGLGSPGGGGTASLGSGPLGLAVSGGAGQAGSFTGSGTAPAGGMGGATPLGGAGAGGGSPKVSAATNSGSGGAGGGGEPNGNATYSGAGGGAGGYVNALITAPAGTYYYAIGSGGSSGGNNGTSGGSGGAGVILVEEFYQ